MIEETQVGDPLVFFRKEDREKIRNANLGKDTANALAIYGELCELASDSGRGTFPLDVEYLRVLTHMSRDHVVKILEDLEWLEIIKLGWEGVTVAYPSRVEKKEIMSEAFG